MIRTVAMLGVGAVGLLTVAGCTKPTPDVTMWTPNLSVSQPAACWAPDSSVSDAVKSCIASAQQGQIADIATLPVTPGNVVGVNVDAVVAEAGWNIAANGQPLAQNLTQSYYRFTMPERQLPDQGFVFAVTARGDASDSNRGIWLFRLVPSGTQ